MVILVAWLVFCVVAGVIAGARGRSAVGYFLLSLFLSPLVGVILAAALPDFERWDSRKCPHCAETIKRAATICRYCSQPVPVAVAAPHPKGIQTNPWIPISIFTVSVGAILAWYLLVHEQRDFGTKSAPVAAQATSADQTTAPPVIAAPAAQKALQPKKPAPNQPLSLLPK